MENLGLRRRLMCNVIDELAEHRPDQLFCVHPVSSDITQGWRYVSFQILADAVNYMAQWIEKDIGRSSQSESLAYMGANDIRYAAFVFACMKTGHAPLLVSSRNSEAAFLHVLTAIKCSKFVYSDELQREVQSLQRKNRDMQIWEVPSLWQIFGRKAKSYPYKKRFADVKDQTAVIIHSSGTTGFPKPVYLTHGYFSVFDNINSMPAPAGRQQAFYPLTTSGEKLLTMTPFFHVMGFVSIISSIFHGIPFVLSPEKPMTVDLLTHILDVAHPQNAIFPPSVIEDLAASDEGMAALKRIPIISFGGAPLSPDVGNKLCEHVNLQSVIGSSEAGVIACLHNKERQDWQWFEWNPYYGIRMEYVADGIYEMVLHKGTSRDFMMIFHTYPDCQEYQTKDLFERHPNKSDLWKYTGRLDDVIVLSNGEKFNPIEMEKIIEGHPLVSRAVIIGQGRFQSALLIQPDWKRWSEGKSENALVDEIWPVIQKANESAPSYGRILKTKIGQASQEKPFQLTPKGSTQRRLVVNDYADEIDALYARPDEESTDGILKGSSLQDITKYVQTVVSQLLSVERIAEDSDIFSLGLDSLRTLQLGKILQGTLRSLQLGKGGPEITRQKLYSYPSVQHLSEYMHCLIHGGGADEILGADAKEIRQGRIAALVDKYTWDLPAREASNMTWASQHIVILTGSTGSLGNYLLYELANDPSITHIYCLNRSDDAAARQARSFKEKGLAIPPDFHIRVEFLQVMFGSVHFGLSEQKYNELRQSVDLVIHNAWKVNFNHRLETFEGVHIRGVRRLVDFSLQSMHQAHIHFISSISTVGAWRAQHGPSVLETPFEDPDVVLRQGYAESKHIAERICAIASIRSGVPTSVYRIGQIGGPTTIFGQWNLQEWLPSIIATSKTIKQIPQSLGEMQVDWIPVDITAKIIFDIIQTRSGGKEHERTKVLHLVNPTSTTWASLIPTVQNHFDVEVVDLQRWLAALDAIANPTEADLENKPALKILEFYWGLLDNAGRWICPVETVRALSASETMRRLGPVDAPLMENWLKQWGF